MGLPAVAFNSDVPGIIDRLLAGHPVDRSDLKCLLSLTDPEEVQALFAGARKARTRVFGKNIFLYGFLYFSTYCRNNCRFCQYRRTNTDLPRYRKSDGEILAAARAMAQSGVHLIDLTMGEDPLYFNSSPSSLERFVDTVAAVKAETNLPIMVSPGVVPDPILHNLAGAGVDWYACYQETHNAHHFRRLRGDQSFAERLDKKRLARQLGMFVEEGILIGTGERIDDLVDSLLFMQGEGIDQVRAMTFVPQPGVTIERADNFSALQEYLTIAVMRLLMPDRLLPASLDVDGLDGLAARMHAGANVVTSIVPPASGLAGVVNKSLDIEEARRTLDHIKPVLAGCGLEVASPQSYREWLKRRQDREGSRPVVAEKLGCA